MKPYYLKFASEAEGRKALKATGMIKTRPLYEHVQTGTEPVTYWTLMLDASEETYTNKSLLLRDAANLLPEDSMPSIALYDDALLDYLKGKGLVTEEVKDEPIYETRQVGEEDYTADTGLDIIGEAWRNDLEKPVKREGWFANWIGEKLPESLAAYVVNPDPVMPFRVFAGWHPEEIAAREVKRGDI